MRKLSVKERDVLKNKEEHIEEINKCDTELKEIADDVHHTNNIKEWKMQHYDKERVVVSTAEYILHPLVRKAYAFMDIAEIREERNLQYQGKLPDNQEKLLQHPLSFVKPRLAPEQ